MKIGIFWVYKSKAKNHVIGKTCDLSHSDEYLPGLCDSPDNHIDVWENDKNWVNPFPELIGTEYQTVPRGRVLYSKQSQKAIIYMDKQLHVKKIKDLIKEFFQLESTPINWSVDEHYTTDSESLSTIFDDDFSINND